MVVCFRFPQNPKGMSSKVSKLCVSQECHCEGLVFPYDGSGFLGHFVVACSFFLAILQVTFSGW